VRSFCRHTSWVSRARSRRSRVCRWAGHLTVLPGVLAVVIALASCVSVPEQGRGPEGPGLLVPMYIYPDTPEDDGSVSPRRRAWDDLAAFALTNNDLHVIAVVNPGSGPGTIRDGNYRAVIASLEDAGVTVSGYVAYGYGSRTTRELRRDLRRWRRLYPTVRSLFLDEVPDGRADRRERLSALAAVVAEARDAGFSGPVIANPGTTVPRGYFAEGMFDLVVTHEDARWPAPETTTLRSTAVTERSVALVYGEGVWDAGRAGNLAADVGYLFVNDHLLDTTGSAGPEWTYFPDNLAEQATIIRTIRASASP
jgi:hypothetical protein